MSERKFLKKETMYGGPKDGFTRLEEWYFLEDDVLTIERKYFARGYFKLIECEVKFWAQLKE